MPLISASLNDVQEASAVPEGEYDLRIVKAEDGETKRGDYMKVVTIEVLDSGVPNASAVKHWIIPPTDPSDQYFNLRALDVKRFLACFGVPINDDGSFDTDDIEAGLEGRCYLTQEEGDNGTVYNRLRLPKLKK